ncbi:hypothetical protein GI364_18120 [Alicyclobacillus sp. SO9]|nr:hypothetical protein GI364_18120 [Alicyclobacillus sp. SO9]
MERWAQPYQIPVDTGVEDGCGRGRFRSSGPKPWVCPQPTGIDAEFYDEDDSA